MSIFIEKGEGALLRFAADSRSEMITFATAHNIDALPHYQKGGYFEVLDGTLKRQLTADPLVDKVSWFEFLLRLKTVCN